MLYCGKSLKPLKIIGISFVYETAQQSSPSVLEQQMRNNEAIRN
jgi:hypothetical protein